GRRARAAVIGGGAAGLERHGADQAPPGRGSAVLAAAVRAEPRRSRSRGGGHALPAARRARHGRLDARLALRPRRRLRAAGRTRTVRAGADRNHGGARAARADRFGRRRGRRVHRARRPVGQPGSGRRTAASEGAQGHRRRHRPHPGLWQGARHSHAGRAARAPVPGAGRPVRGGGHRPGAAAQGLRRDRGALCRAPGWWRARCLLMPQETPPMTDTPTRKTPATLRSHRWFASDDIRGFAHRQRMQQQGLNREEFMGRPVIALINTWSDLSPCHAHLRERAEAVKRGVLQAGGYPLELPALSLGEVMVKPTTMLYRNLLSVECEELLRRLPIDGAVLMGGCDTTPPALVMGALSMDLPVIFMPAGPMLNDRYRGQAVGAGTHTKKFFAEYTIGAIGKAEWVALESRMTRSV